MQVSEGMLYINLGQQDGILEGNQFEIVRPGKPLRSGDQIIGYEEQTIGKAEAERVRSNMTVAKMTQQTGPAPSPGDKAYQVRKRIQRVVVVPFTL